MFDILKDKYDVAKGIVEKGEQVHLVAFVEDDEKMILVTPDQIRDTDDKDGFVVALAKIMATTNPKSVTLVFEAWIKTVSKDDKETINRTKNRGVSKEAEKDEGVIFYHETPDGKHSHYTSLIKEVNGKRTLMEPEEMPSDGKAFGRLCNLFMKAKLYKLFMNS